MILNRRDLLALLPKLAAMGAVSNIQQVDPPKPGELLVFTISNDFQMEASDLQALEEIAHSTGRQYLILPQGIKLETV